MDIDTRVAIVTGAAQGIGARIAQVLADEGYVVATYDRQTHDTPRGLAYLGDVTS